MPALAASRILRAGGHTLEALGKIRLETRGSPAATRLRARARTLREVAAAFCRIHNVAVELDGVLPNEPAILISNHVSYVDAPVLVGLSPCMPIAKGEVASWPLLGAAARSLGVAFVERGDAHSGALALRAALRALDAGVSVLGFPEGTTTRGDDLLPFRRGLFGAARIAGARVVPIAIHYPSPEVAWVGEEWFLPHYLRTAMRPVTRVSVAIGAPIDPAAAGCAEDLAHLCRSSIRQLLFHPRERIRS